LRITEYVADLVGVDHGEARRIQKHYFHSHGTTLSGLMTERHVDPHHYLAYVHDVEMNVLEPNALLRDALARLPGRKLVFTNGDAPYAARVLDRLGLSEAFEAVHDIHATQYRPKPDPDAYRGLCQAYAIDPRESLFVEDMARNLKPAKAIGMTTVWVDNGSEQTPDEDRSFIDYTTADIGLWLHDILEENG
jgi:putative hydrolase of the HAD superfamily